MTTSVLACLSYYLPYRTEYGPCPEQQTVFTSNESLVAELLTVCICTALKIEALHRLPEQCQLGQADTGLWQ